MTLIGLMVVMVIQDPVMSIFGFVVVPPALIVFAQAGAPRLRPLAQTSSPAAHAVSWRRCRRSLQGLRTVKAFTLEDTMTARLNEHIAAVQRDADKLARLVNRSSPLMETLGGIAIAAALTYGGYRVINRGDSPASSSPSSRPSCLPMNPPSASHASISN